MYIKHIFSIAVVLATQSHSAIHLIWHPVSSLINEPDIITEGSLFDLLLIFYLFIYLFSKLNSKCKIAAISKMITGLHFNDTMSKYKYKKQTQGKS